MERGKRRESSAEVSRHRHLMDAQRGNPVRRSAGTRVLMSAQLGFLLPGHSGTPGKSRMRRKSEKIQILRRNGSSGRNDQDSADIEECVVFPSAHWMFRLSG